MRFLRPGLFFVLTAAASLAQAHTHLTSSAPADKSRVRAPAAIQLHFSEAARLTALTLQKGTEAPTPLKPLPTTAAADLSVPVTALAAGDYVVSWRVVGDDGHVMDGKFAFTVDPAAPMDHMDHMNHMKMGEEKKPGATEDQHKH